MTKSMYASEISFRQRGFIVKFTIKIVEMQMKTWTKPENK
jgi:hypothetical protein